MGAPPKERLEWVGDRYLRLVLGDDGSVETAHRVRDAVARLREARVPALVDVTPAYATVLLAFDLRTLEAGMAEEAVRRALRAPAAAPEAAGPPAEIPVCYDPDLGLDLAEVARLHGLRPEQVVRLHAGAAYTVAFLGFSPGFPYLLGLPESLHTPRLERPRLRVPAGSVAIAGAQAGIYPRETPGGWRVLGRTPCELFEPARERPARLRIGETLRFVPIDRARFDDLAAAARGGRAPPS